MPTKNGSKPARKGGGGSLGARFKGWLSSFTKLLKENALPALLGLAVAAAVSVVMDDKVTAANPAGAPGIVKLIIAAALPVVAGMFLGKFITRDVATRASAWALGLVFAWKSLVGFLMTLPGISNVVKLGQKAGETVKNIKGTSAWFGSSTGAPGGAPTPGNWRAGNGAGVRGWNDFAHA